MENVNIAEHKNSKASILQALRLYKNVSRVQLSELTGLSRATISLAISELIDMGLVQQTRSRQSTGGRPAISLQLAPYTRGIIGADFNNTEWTLGAFDLPGNVLKKVRIPVKNSAPKEVIRALTDKLNPFIQSLNTPPLPLLGLSMPGLINTKLGLIYSASDLDWHNIEIGKEVNETIDWSTIVLNRHKARGLSECRYGAAKEHNEVIYIGIGTGIASGLFHNLQLISGAIGGAGELGHITIEPNGPLCPCGNKGCLQLLATGPAIEKEARMLLRTGEPSVLQQDPYYDLQLLKAEDICIAADQHDQLAMQVVEKAATYLGIAMANLVNILNPEVIILGGSIPKCSSLYIKIAEKVMKQHAMSPLTANITVKTSTFTEIGGALGAANLALDHHINTIFDPVPASLKPESN
ncbi:ROK family protein [Bacillus sp. SA1-12]|uniref:ROK family transcriptional regulator n=1 Tax=Bacillus sp. SA1-12 TaxID=1455638 RepID=UPI00062736E6|nr:ROK family transcriptional regulator [Bacillus sp. SA1-12]KKI90892.1 ROK family protein [Bacillus sp. SA1-12]